MQDYYKRKQQNNDEMAEYLYYMVLVFVVLACAWAVIELFRYLSSI